MLSSSFVQDIQWRAEELHRHWRVAVVNVQPHRRGLWGHLPWGWALRWKTMGWLMMVGGNI